MLSKLTLIVTHSCNLRCTYCYAKGGDFGLPVKTMTISDAIKIVDHFAITFDGIKEIFYFGGEPLLAFDVIKAVCLHSEKLVSEKILPVLPKFVLITNGTLISDEFVKLAIRFDIGITISIDGPKYIHDLHRKTTKNEDTFDKVFAGINLLKNSSVPFSVEGTYTRDHWDAGYKPLDIYKYLQSLGAISVILTEQIVFNETVYGICDDYKEQLYVSSIDLFSYAIDEVSTYNKLQHAGLAKAYDSVLNKPEYLEYSFCGGGCNNFAVNPAGHTYPCHMLNNQELFGLGDFRGVNSPADVLPKKSNFKECIECPVKALCRACPARMYFYNESNQIAPIESECRAIRAFACLAKQSLLEGVIP